MESTEKMVQLPMTEYLELVKQCAQVKELTERLAKLEEHCEKTNGFVRNKTVTHHWSDAAGFDGILIHTS